MKKNTNIDLGERQMMGRDDLKVLEKSFIRLQHFERYASVRRFCFGKVLDFACGTGYGSLLISPAEDISQVVGIDLDPSAITLALKEFKNGKTSFRCAPAYKISGKFDTLVCLETIEHIKDSQMVPRLVERCKIDNVIVSFPDKKTTHYNKFHLHDFVRQDIIDLFPGHVVYHQIKSFDSQILFLMRLPAKAPGHMFRNIRDLE